MKTLALLNNLWTQTLTAENKPEAFANLRALIRQAEQAELAKGFMGADHQMLAGLREILRAMDKQEAEWAARESENAGW